MSYVFLVFHNSYEAPVIIFIRILTVAEINNTTIKSILPAKNIRPKNKTLLGVKYCMFNIIGEKSINR
ncbi:MAG: hypothetical protein QXL51_07790, partial [Candidatus Aenigmatarchaeota archaeon]